MTIKNSSVRHVHFIVSLLAALSAAACGGSAISDGNGGGSGGSGAAGSGGGPGGCAGVACSVIACGPGMKIAQQPGQCCPTCVAANACDTGEMGYRTLRTQLLASPGAIACQTAKDCVELAEHPFCGDVCSSIPVNASQEASIDAQLTSWDKANCSTCTPIYPPCAAPSPPLCDHSQCVPAPGGGP